MVSTFRFVVDPLTPGLAAAGAKAQAFLERATTYHALRAEAYAKINAGWTDRTGNARQGLASVGSSAPGHHEIVLYHSVPYGIWLEVRFAGKYAIIRPTIEHEAPEYFDTARGLLKAMFG
jgi:hypothetical protein